MSFRGWSIRKRLLLAFVGVLIPYLALVAIGVVGFQVLSKRLQSVEQDVVGQLESTTGLQLVVLQLVMPANDFLITGDPAEREKFERILAQVQQAFARVEAAHGQHPEHRLLGEVQSQVARIGALSREILAVPDPRGDRSAVAKMKALDELGDDAAATLTRLQEINRREIKESIGRSSGLIWRVSAAGLAALVLSLTGGVVLALLFSRWVGGPIQAIARASHVMAQGDLSQRIEADTGAELGETARAFNTMAERLETSYAALRRTNEESEGRRRAAEALAAVGRDLVQSLDVAVVGQRIIESVRQLLRVGFSALYRLERGSGDLVAVAVSKNMAPIMGPGLVFPKGVGAIGLAVKERRLMVSEDVLADPRVTFTPEVRARVEQAGFRAIIALPLLAKEGVIGVLGIGDEQGRVFDAEEVHLAQAFADQAAIALENARLFQEAQQALADAKAAQEQLVQGATMRALGELAAGAAHHLNNLMAIVLGRVRLLLSGPESAPVRRPLEIIERAAVDAAEVVRRVSRFARMQPMEEQTRLDLRQLVSEVLELTRPRWEDAAQAGGIRIHAALEGEAVPEIVGNGAALRELLMNLVLNAVDALPRGGQISLRTFSEDGWVGLAVTDTGVGMSREIQERALEPFFTTKGPKSMGLGLSVAYGILQRHGGKLTVESSGGHGTTVTIRLPVGSGSEGQRLRAEPARREASTLRILVIDDEEEVRGVVAEMLAALGHKVLQAAGGREGLALLDAGEKVDLVLTDLGMPGMNGWEVARTIRARWPGLSVGILTGWGEQMDEASADRQMVAGVLAKPATPESLQEFIAACRGASRGI